MNLSVSTNYWSKQEKEDIIISASDYGFSGVELYGIEEYTDAEIAEIRKTAMKNRIYFPCLDMKGVLSGSESLKNLTLSVKAAVKLGSPYVRIKLDSDNPGGIIQEALSVAEKHGIVLLVETSNIFADTKRLKDFLVSLSSDYIAALWDFSYPYWDMNETPEETINNLSSYIKHVHIKDMDKDRKHRFVGDGDMPIGDFANGLRCINYSGYGSVEWNPDWDDEIKSQDVIFPYFVNYLYKYQHTARAGASLYYNNAGTGKYIWKKDILIEYTFSQLLDKMVKEFPDQYAIKYTTLSYTRTYKEFRDDVDEFARALVAMGVKPGYHVAVWATNVPQWYIAFWATVKIGAVLVTMNTAYKIHEAEYLLKQSDTHTLIMIEKYRDSNYAEIISELCPEIETLPEGKQLHSKRLPFLRNVISVGFERKGFVRWRDALTYASKVPLDEIYRIADAVDVHDVCNMQYTSGTTGFPKGVMLTHYNIINNGKCIGDRMDLSTADRMMIQVPMFHCFGMVLAMTATMTHGGTILPLPYFTPKPALACINQERITCFHGVPTMFIAMLEHPDFDNTDFSYMRTGIMAGSPCPEPVMKQVVEKMNMKEITIVYGQTEASPGCTMSSTDDSIAVRVSTVGRPLPEIECRIIDPETGEVLPDNETGEFVARGYNIMKGYYKMPKATEDTIDKDGWLHTGDLAMRTSDGNYRITGRLKDMIIRGGENIYPKEIEEFIYTHPKVKDVQVIGVPDEQYGEEIMACIILKDGEEMTEDEMKTYIKEHMAKHKVPKYIDFVKEFPMNVAGKILKYKMREDAINRLNIKKVDGIVTE